MKYSRRNRKSKNKGGNVGTTVNYGSASNYMLKTVGDANRQYDDVFSVNSPFAGKGNTIVSLKGQYLGGKAKKRTRKAKKGGNLAQVINQAIIPFGLLGLQQSYRRKKGGKTRKHRRRH